MLITKKVQCLSCGTVIEGMESSTVKCSCGTVSIIDGKIIAESRNYIDMSPKLLME